MSTPLSSKGPQQVDEAPSVVIPFDGSKPVAGTRIVPIEVPVSLTYGGIPFAVMMVTPSDLDDFAIGFSLTEGIIQRAGDIRSVRLETEADGLRLVIDLIPERLHEHLARRRVLAGRTGCGVCGIDDLEALPRANRPGGTAPTVAPSAIYRALTKLESRQPLNGITHAVHAAAWADLDGMIIDVREDVGRHNALDKLLGALCRAEADPSDGFAVVTSRCSFELVEKIAAFGARTLITISAPTSLALERARQLDITLIGVARSDSITVFHGIDRVGGQDVVA